MSDKPTSLVQVTPAATQLTRAQERAEKLARLAEIEDQVLEKSLTTVASMLAWSEIDPENPLQDYPESWSHLSEDDKAERMRIARACWRNKQEAPVGLSYATQTLAGIQKSRSSATARPQAPQLNVLINIPAPTSKEHPEAASEKYEVIDVD